jgi:hypothetical protein
VQFISSTTGQDWISLNFNQVLTSRHIDFEIMRDQNYKIGSNKISNQLPTINKQLPLTAAAAKTSFSVVYTKMA